MIPRNNLALPILTPASNLLSKIGARYFGTAEAPSSDYQQSRHSLSNDDDYPALDWSNLGFNLTPVDYMYVMKSGEGEEFKFELEEGEIRPFGNIELSPAAGVLNYGQGLLEGLKAYRRDDGGICLFRPQENAIRMQIGARRMCMPSPSVAQFVEAVKQITLANKRWIPPLGKGSLYIRPLLMGTGATLGVAPAPEYTFLLYASPVGNYFKGGQLRINLYVEEDYHRATRGGVGGVKSITNYAPVMQAMISAKGRGFSDVLYLDSVNKRYVEEASASNVFIVKGNVLSTPATTGTILEGITRTTIMEIARDSGYQVEERSISIDELIDADEAFCTGTAAVIAPVGSVTYQGKRSEYKQQTSTSVSEKLHSTLTGIQRGTVEDNKGWILKIH